MPRFSFISGGMTQLESERRPGPQVHGIDIDADLPALQMGMVSMRSHSWWEMNAKESARRRKKLVA
jgi:hypothetical protein